MHHLNSSKHNQFIINQLDQKLALEVAAEMARFLRQTSWAVELTMKQDRDH
jgi:hypothetical protein